MQLRLLAVTGIVGSTLLISACGGSSNSPSSNSTPTPASASPAAASPTSSGSGVADVISDFAGAFHGTWTNTTFGSTGTAATDITVDKAGGNVTFKLTLTGGVFGGTAPAPETFTGKFDNAGAKFTGTSPTFGAYTLSIDKTGALTMDCPAVPSARVKTFSVAGTVTKSKMDLTYTVSFKAGGADAKGTIALTK